MSRKIRRCWNAIITILLVCALAVGAWAARIFIPRTNAAQEILLQAAAKTVIVTISTPVPLGAVWVTAGDDGEWAFPPAPTLPPSSKYYGYTDDDVYALAMLAARPWDGHKAATTEDAMRIMVIACNRNPSLSPMQAAQKMGSPKTGVAEQWHIDAARAFLDGAWATTYPIEATHFSITAEGAVKIW